MGKTKKIKNVISEEHLESVKSKQGLLNNIVGQIGAIEAQKHALLHNLAEVNKQLEDVKVELEKEYGRVSIDLETGEYTFIEEESNAVEHTEN